jgi:hypothetical protein
MEFAAYLFYFKHGDWNLREYLAAIAVLLYGDKMLHVDKISWFRRDKFTVTFSDIWV